MFHGVRTYLDGSVPPTVIIDICDRCGESYAILTKNNNSHQNYSVCQHCRTGSFSRNSDLYVKTRGKHDSGSRRTSNRATFNTKRYKVAIDSQEGDPHERMGAEYKVVEGVPH